MSQLITNTILARHTPVVGRQLTWLHTCHIKVEMMQAGQSIIGVSIKIGKLIMIALFLFYCISRDHPAIVNTLILVVGMWPCNAFINVSVCECVFIC